MEDKHLAKVYEKLPVVIVRGKGAILWDIDGKKYIDCMGGYGVAIVGHCNPRIVDALKEQSKRLITCHGSLYNDVRADLLEKITKISPKGLDEVYLCNSGAESVECALKLARKYSGRPEVIAMTRSYHGKTLGALSATWNKKYRSEFEPLVPEIKFTSFGDADKVREAVTDKTGAIIVEPVQGEGGIHVAPDGFLEELREICYERDILLIFDEVQTGFGRTGKMWACEHWNVIPDVMCLAKGIGGGLPLGATLAKEEVMSTFKVGDHTSTLGGNPLSCATACATIDYILEENLVERAMKLGAVFRDGLERLKMKYQIVREVRGLGLMLGMELRFDIRNILMRGVEEGAIMLYSGRNVLRFLPPLIISEVQIHKAIDILDSLISEEEDLRTGK
ncbi:MAG: aspartate aminotransferase family protein [Candidatus Methylarchaceae archaeon HK02M1]|nr:aspartate aminotransferase family protein [Candidatus Methylarchaceae archaeon HK01M]MCP8311601.1 aspartate aminotransferase family protein [Candidatus Methylarchaceae archaeon HK02M1]